MNLQKAHPDSDFSNSTVPAGSRLVFLGYANGSSGAQVIRYKDSSGQFGTMVNAGNVDIVDSGAYFQGSTVEQALQEVGAQLDGVQTTLEGI